MQDLWLIDIEATCLKNKKGRVNIVKIDAKEALMYSYLGHQAQVSVAETNGKVTCIVEKNSTTLRKSWYCVAHGLPF